MLSNAQLVNSRVHETVREGKTRSVFDRYNIVNQRDLVQATNKLQDYLSQQSQKPKVQPLKAAATAPPAPVYTLRPAPLPHGLFADSRRTHGCPTPYGEKASLRNSCGNLVGRRRLELRTR